MKNRNDLQQEPLPLGQMRLQPQPSKMEKVKGTILDFQHINKILVVQIGDLGDVLVSFPAIQALKESFPNAKVSIAIHEKAADLMEGCHWADELIKIVTNHGNFKKAVCYHLGFIQRLRKEKFDLVVDLRTSDRSAILTFFTGARQKLSFWGYHNSWWRNRIYTHLIHPYPPRGHQHIVDFYLNPLLAYGIIPSSRHPIFNIADRHREAASALLMKEGIDEDNKPLIAFQPFSIWQYKQWPEPNNSSFIEWLIGRYQARVLIMGTANQAQEAEAMSVRNPAFTHNLAGKTDLSTLAAILHRCALSIGIDSFGGHLAAAVGTPTITLFGPGKSVEWAPYGDQAYVITKGLSCQPCGLKGCDGGDRSRCLEELSIQDVQDQAQSIIDTIFGVL